MAIEIERKFLVNKPLWDAVEKDDGLYCEQTYLVTDIDKTIRVRVIGNKAFLTIKGKTSNLSRSEFEYEIPIDEGKAMIAQFGEKVLIKTRYIVPIGKHNWEVDVFDGDNKGLIVAEIELTSETEDFILPEWVTEEVSHDARYYNACLQKNPFCNW